MLHQQTNLTASLMLSPQELTPKSSPRRIKIYFQDDELRQRSEERMHQLLTSAVSASTSDNNSLLARKALKYRKMLTRVQGVDVTSPEFDASKFMGVDWCKTARLEGLCQRQH